MATRIDVEKKIKDISDGGNNTAAEVRDVLTNLLDYTENVPFPPSSNVEFFHFWTDEKPVQDKIGNNLWYSIKGMKDQWINLTFSIEINKTTTSTSTNNFSSNVFSFPLQDKDTKILEYLKNILLLNEPSVRFIIPYTTRINEQIIDYPLSTSIYFVEKNIVFDFNNNINMNNAELGIATGKATSSVSFHFPFKFLKLK